MDKVEVLAKTLNVDPLYFLRLILTEYRPELLALLERITNQPQLTNNEIEIIKAIREANPNDPKLATGAQHKMLQALAESISSN